MTMMDKGFSKLIMGNTFSTEELAKLKKLDDVDNNVFIKSDDLVICTANENHVNEIAELWANHAAIQYLSAPERYNFKFETKDWREFVRNKLNKKHNLLLVAHEEGEEEIKGFLYLQTITIPSSNLVLKGVVEDIYTKPQYRKLGIATKLLEVGISWSLKNYIKQIDLISLHNAKDVSEFYSKFLKSGNQSISLEVVTF